VKLRDVRAGLVAAAIGFGLVDGCPLASPDHVPAWERSFVEPIRSAQRVVETPVAWIRATFHITQQWALYQAPVSNRFRMWIEGATRDGHWRVLYRAGDPEHAEDGDAIEHARVWGTWDPTDVPPAEYGAFAGWISRRALAAHPDLAAVRVRMERVTLGIGEVEPTGELVWPIVTVRR
jgi:hypothetical protein